MTNYDHVLIRASAGTGKTFQLSNRYLGLLAAGAAPDQILATTFTRKAAGEILDRILARLATAALDAQARADLAEHLELQTLSEAECHQLLRRVINHLHRLKICTLDAFFAQLASSFSLELGLPPDWRIIEPLLDDVLRDMAIEATLQDVGHRDVQRLIQLMAKGEAQRSVSELVRSTVADLYGLYLETDRAAWQRIPRPRLLRDNELDAALEALRTAPLPKHKSISTSHAASVASAEAGDWETFINKGIASKVRAGETTFYRKEIPDETLTAYDRLIAHARGVLLRQVADQTDATYALLDRFHSVYEQLKHQHHMLRFEDVTRALTHGPSIGGIAQQQYRLDAQLRHLLLDEFQDTSLSQWHVVRPLARHLIAEAAGTNRLAGPKPSFFCVGDVKQAIYGWRGGRSEIFDALENELVDVRSAPLNTSYRSAQPIIDTVNTIFTRMTRHGNLEKYEPAVDAWCKAFQRHTTKRTAMAGYAELRTVRRAGEDESQDDVTMAQAADQVARLVDAAPERSFGVLVRTNDHVTQMIYLLRQRGTPASEEGGNPLTDSPAVQIVLSLLKMTDHPGDSAARFHVAESPLAKAVGLTDYRDSQQAIQVAMDLRRQLLHQGYGITVLQWAEAIAPDGDARERSRLRQLTELAFGYESMATLRTMDFVRYVERERVADPTTAAVRVMTIHQAKGLQFDIVVLPDLKQKLVGQPPACVVGQPTPTECVDRVCLYRNEAIQSLLPQTLQKLFAQATNQSVSESLCVLYVALTRAVHALHMIIAPAAKSEKKLPKTADGLLRAALTEAGPVEPGQVVYQTGDPEWYLAEPLPTSEPSADEQLESTSDKSARPIKLAPPVGDGIVEHTSPSHLEGNSRVVGARLLQLESSIAMARGTLIHALFEQIQWLDDEHPSAAALRRVAEPLLPPGLDLEPQITAFEAMLEMPEVSAVLSRSFYQVPYDPSIRAVLPAELLDSALRAEVHNERRFVIRDKHRLLSGSIDRLVLLYAGTQVVAAHVIDFKTDLVEDTGARSLKRLHEHYRPQIEAYCRAVARMFNLPASRIASRLLFVAKDLKKSE